MTLNENLNVGIGTTAPSERLDVVGNVRFSGALMPNNLPGTTGQILTSAGVSVAPTWTTPSAANTPNIYTEDGTLTANRTVTMGSNNLAFTGTGNVGIGTTTPGAKLAVNGGIVVDDGGTNNGTHSAISGLLFGSASSGEGISSKRTVTGNQYGLDFYTDKTNRMAILFNGNVGIGTITPTSRLQVTGLPVHADNAAALTAGLTAGAFFHNGDGILRVVF